MKLKTSLFKHLIAFFLFIGLLVIFPSLILFLPEALM